MKTICFGIALALSCLASRTATADSPIQPGDRIAIIGNTFADQLRTHGYLETLLLQHHRQEPVSIRNLGWGGDMLSARDRPTNFPSEESTLTAHKTDVIIACFGMGESFAGEEGVNDFKQQLKSLIESHAGKKYNGESEVRLILVSPIAHEDLGELTPRRDKRNGELHAYMRAMQKVADANDIPFVDLFQPSQYLMDEATGPNLTTNGIHLNSYGYWALSHTFFDQLTASDRKPNQAAWRLRVDVAANSAEAEGVEISELKQSPSGVSFRVKETCVPRLRPPADLSTDSPLQPQIELARDTLVVKNLSPGRHRLTVDGRTVVEADAEAWSNGVAIDSSPAHKAADQRREAVNNKNMQFTYSWKALNQVHIVGERKKSPSGKELPKEVIQFNQLANDLDAVLGASMQLTTREWVISRVESEAKDQ